VETVNTGYASSVEGGLSRSGLAVAGEAGGGFGVPGVWGGV